MPVCKTKSLKNRTPVDKPVARGNAQSPRYPKDTRCRCSQTPFDSATGHICPMPGVHAVARVSNRLGPFPHDEATGLAPGRRNQNKRKNKQGNREDESQQGQQQRADKRDRQGNKKYQESNCPAGPFFVYAIMFIHLNLLIQLYLDSCHHFGVRDILIRLFLNTQKSRNQQAVSGGCVSGSA